jgi:hypothetical protein
LAAACAGKTGEGTTHALASRVVAQPPGSAPRRRSGARKPPSSSPLPKPPRAPRSKRVRPQQQPRAPSEDDGTRPHARKITESALSRADYLACSLRSVPPHLLHALTLPASRSAARAGFDSSDDDDEAGAGGKPGGRAGRAFVSPEERERKRLRRLMRNRASAQQARERKKLWMNNIESRHAHLETAVTSLESRHALLERENWTLRALLKTAVGAPGASMRPPSMMATPIMVDALA